MRISKLRVPDAIAKKTNLKAIDLTRKSLGPIVALFGKNGAGKSRVLKLIETYVQSIDPRDFLEGHLQFLPDKVIAGHLKTVQECQTLFNREIANRVNQNGKLRTLFDQIVIQVNPALQRVRELGLAYVKVVDNDDLKVIKANLSNGLTFEKILANGHFADYMSAAASQHGTPSRSAMLVNEFTVLNNQATIDYIIKLTNEVAIDEFNLYIEHRDHPIRVREDIQSRTSYQLFEKLRRYVLKFLGKDLSYRQTTQANVINSQLYYDGQPFNLNLFSPGQKTLFAYAILFFYLEINSGANIRDCILIIDEPEKHLHPEAQITLMNALKSIIEDRGQLWIATHSIHILSHLECDQIMLVNEGEIIKPSRLTPGKSFVDLMGVEDHIDELTSFINSVSEWAYANFIIQCFKAPEVIFANDVGDPQFQLFKQFILDKKGIKLLDFGAGKGRIGHTLRDEVELASAIQYYALEPNEMNHELLRTVPNIVSIYKDSSEIADGSFDCVLICNVLHEINPLDWVRVLSEARRILNDSGYLLIIEDRYLPRGENAHVYGYLILNIEQIRCLMNSNESTDLMVKNEEYAERIVFSAFKKNEILPSPESVVASIELLKQHSFTRLSEIRKLKIDLSQGRLYANETQLFVSATLALRALRETDQIEAATDVK